MKGFCGVFLIVLSLSVPHLSAQDSKPFRMPDFSDVKPVPKNRPVSLKTTCHPSRSLPAKEGERDFQNCQDDMNIMNGKQSERDAMGVGTQFKLLGN